MATRRGSRALGSWALGWAACPSAVLLVAATVVLERHAHAQERVSSLAGQYAYLGLALPLSVSGALIWLRRPGNRIGLLLIAAAVAIAGDQLTWDGLLYLRSHGDHSAWLVGWLSNWLWVVPPAVLLTGLLIFPDGRLPGPGWRPMAWVVGGWTATTAVLAALGAGVYNYEAHYRAVPLPPRVAGTLHSALLVVFALFPVVLCGVTGAVLSRVRRARSVERSQLRCLGYAASLVAVIWLVPAVHHSGSWSRALANLSLWSLPLAIAVAVLRYRLYQIDRFVGRALRYIALTTCVAGAYVLVVALLREAVPSRSVFWTAAATAAVLTVLASQAGVAVHAVRLAADLQRSRERLVTAREEERRRLRRDLHDGLGPALAGLVFRLDATERLLPAEPGRAAEHVAAVRADLKGTIGDVRRLVDGLRPPALDELGLVAALREHAARGGEVIVDVDAPHPLPLLPAAVEVAAYRIITEALTNVTRHAAARTCTVRLRAGEALHLEIADDGCGMPDTCAPGVGLLSMRERAVELGGTCVVDSRAGGGTTVSVRLPLTSESP